MNLKRVCDGKYLHWPPEIDKKDILWLPPGGILDWDDAFVRRCARGQEYKLEDAPKGSTATPIDHKLFDMAREELIPECSGLVGAAYRRLTDAAP